MQGRVFVSLSGPLMAAGNPILFLLQVPVNAVERAFRASARGWYNRWCPLSKYGSIKCMTTLAGCGNEVSSNVSLPVYPSTSFGLQ